MQSNKNKIKSNPFPGLHPYETDQSHLFFGREGQSEVILNYLNTNRFAAITGASGSGKSSLVYCGVIPLLYGGFIENASDAWRITSCRPGNAPIWNLARALNLIDPNTDNDDEEAINYIYTLLRRQSSGLAEVMKELNLEEGESLFILIDQFEELFRYKKNLLNKKTTKDESEAYTRLIVNAIQNPDLPVYVVLTMRSDFIGDCTEYQNLTQLINKSHYLIPQMTRDDYENVITGPIHVAGAEIEPRLLQEILNRVENNHDQLPVLQHALMRTWEFWEKQDNQDIPISMRDYMAAGKIDNAISMHANEAFNQLNDTEKELAKIIFKSLTEKGAEDKGIRRPVTVTEIAVQAQVQPKEIMKVVEVFRQSGRSFLTPPVNRILTPNTIIDISHEALMRIWDKLKNWVEEEAQSAQTYLKLIETADQYQHGRTGLLRPPDLHIATNWRKEQSPNKAWAKRYNPAFEKAMVYLSSSEKRYQLEEESKIKLKHRQLYRTRRLAILMGLFAIAFLALVFYAYRQSQEAIRQKERAEEYASIVEGEKDEAVELTQQTELAKLRVQREKDSLDQLRMMQLVEKDVKTQQAYEIIDSVTRKSEEIRLSTQQRMNEEVRLAEERTREALANKTLSEVERKEELQKRRIILSKAIAIKAAYEENSQVAGLLAVHAYDIHRESGGQINHPDIYTGLYNALSKLKGKKYNALEGHSSPIQAVVFDPARNLLYSTDNDGIVLRWGFRKTNPTPRVLISDVTPNTCMDITSDGMWMVIGTEFNNIKLYNALNPAQSPRTFDAHNGVVNAVKFLPGKNAIISAGSDNKVKYWDLLSNEATLILQDNSGINNVETSLNGNFVICATNNGRIHKWDVNTKQVKILYRQSKATHALSIDKESEKIAIGDIDGNITIISAANGKKIVSFKAHSKRVIDLEFSPDNRLLASTGMDAIIRIWNIVDLNDLPIEIKESQSWVKSIAFSPDGRNLMTTSDDGNVIYMWPVKSELLKEELCSLINRQLTEQEWKQNFGNDFDYRQACR